TLPDTVSARAFVRVSPSGGGVNPAVPDASDYSLSIVRPAPDWPAATRLTPAFAGRRDGERFGAALAVGDADRGGVADVAVGAPEGDGKEPRAGRVEVEWGGDSGRAPLVFEGQHSGDGFGAALALGDLNGDGLAEILVGALGATGGNGAATLWSGA